MTQVMNRTDVVRPGRSRWLLVGAGLLLQFSIGAVYAWSVFAKALRDAATGSSSR